MTMCAEIQSSRPITEAVQILAPVSAWAEPPTGERFIFVAVETRPQSDSVFVPIITSSRPFAASRIISDEPAQIMDWTTYEYPWLPESSSGILAGEIVWPEVDLDY